jgi:hypothetical protein
MTPRKDPADYLPLGRPHGYTTEIAEKFCTRLVNGESMRGICKDKDMPSHDTICRWLATIPDFAERYARAREDQAETLADEIVYIADNCTDPNKAKLQVDARKWVASKLKPKRYGERIDVNQQTTVQAMPDDQLFQQLTVIINQLNLPPEQVQELRRALPIDARVVEHNGDNNGDNNPEGK